MGYTLRAFLGPTPDVHQLAGHFQHAYSVAVVPGLSLLPMTSELYDEVNTSVDSVAIGPFLFLTTHIEQQILALIGPSRMGYVEADYFGGKGQQVGLLWQAGQQITALTTINAVLRGLGIKADCGRDEFATVDLGRYQETEDWLPT